MRLLPAATALLILSGCALERTPIDHGQFEFGEFGEFGAAGMEGADIDDGAMDGSAETDADAGLEAVDDGEAMEKLDDGSTMRDMLGQGPNDDPDGEPVVETPRFEGSCSNDGQCADDEVCVKSSGLTGSASYCAQACNVDADCAPGPGGTAAVCADNGGDGRCHLACDALINQTCPGTMICRDQLLFLSGGSCLFQQ